jgi:hypothetical protein
MLCGLGKTMGRSAISSYAGTNLIKLAGLLTSTSQRSSAHPGVHLLWHSPKF